jgi:hypothetical protein
MFPPPVGIVPVSPLAISLNSIFLSSINFFKVLPPTSKLVKNFLTESILRLDKLTLYPWDAIADAEPDNSITILFFLVSTASYN